MVSRREPRFSTRVTSAATGFQRHSDAIKRERCGENRFGAFHRRMRQEILFRSDRSRCVGGGKKRRARVGLGQSAGAVSLQPPFALYQTVRQIARLPSPWTASLCLLMLVIGFLTNLLGRAEKIHVVRNPVLLLVAWNLL